MAALGVRATLAALCSITALLPPAANSADIWSGHEPRPPATVFTTDQLVPTFETLRSRGCLPERFDYSHTMPVARACAQQLNTGCGGVPALAVFYNCLAYSLGLLDETRFNVASFDSRIDAYTDNAGWLAMARGFSAACQRSADARLSPRQQAVFLYSCWKWRLFADCDRRQQGSQSAAAALRRASFLSGSCPLSPDRLLDPFGLVTGRTWTECSRDATLPSHSTRPHASVSAQQLYAAELRRVGCLLQDFVRRSGGHLDIARLSAAVRSRDEDRAATARLLDVLAECGGRPARVPHLRSDCHRYSRSPVPWCPAPRPAYRETGGAVTVQQFVACWAQKGVTSCAHAEANTVALQFHEQCKH